MRTTLDLDDDVLAAARELASSQGASLGVVISALARAGLAPRSVEADGELPVIRAGDGATPITTEMVKRGLDDW